MPPHSRLPWIPIWGTHLRDSIIQVIFTLDTMVISRKRAELDLAMLLQSRTVTSMMNMDLLDYRLLILPKHTELPVPMFRTFRDNGWTLGILRVCYGNSIQARVMMRN